MTISMTAFSTISVDKERKTLTVGAGATWGEVLHHLEPLGLVPKVMVSTRRATVGGTLSANSLSRFSCIYGCEGHSTESFRLALVDGQILTCSRQENPELFFGVIGGFGNLGVIVDVTYNLLSKESPIRVETRFRKSGGVKDLHRTLLPSADPEQATCVVLAIHGRSVRQLFTSTRYCTTPKLRQVWLYRPVNAFRVFAELLVHRIGWLGPLIWNFGYRFVLRTGTPYTDLLSPFTFFTDGNVAARDWLRGRGLPFRMLEQTYLLPAGGPAVEGFVDELVAGCLERQVHPMLFDVTYLPQDEPFLLSSTRGLAGYAVNIAFEGLTDNKVAAVQEMFATLSQSCLTRGGRVHLVKNVFAAPEVLSKMYGDGVDLFFALKRRYDPHRVLGSGFLERVFGRPYSHQPASQDGLV